MTKLGYIDRLQFLANRPATVSERQIQDIANQYLKGLTEVWRDYEKINAGD